MTVASLCWIALAVTEPSVDFETEIIPVLTKYGCNAGACHGSAAGRGGFKLSLWGSDPESDYEAIVYELKGRRVHFAKPDQSLVLLKPAEYLSHGGGTRFDIESPPARRLLQWIDEGARRRGTDSRRLLRLKVEPNSQVLSSSDAAINLQAVAHFDNGDEVDVTRWTVFTAADSSAVEIDSKTAHAIVHRRGQHTVIARFLNQVKPIRLIIPYADAPADLSVEPRANFIDERVLSKLEQLRLPVSPPTDDEAFLRRARLALTGRLPTLEEIESFTTDNAEDKRSRLIDRLLDSSEFADYWAFQLAKLLRVRSFPKDDVAPQVYHEWLRKAIEQSVPYDEMARAMLTATGDSHEVGPANFYRTGNGPRELAEHVSQVFMGVRLRCANCHNHPLDRWTQDDYHGLSAIFAKLERGRVIQVSARGEVSHPKTNEPALPRIPSVRFLDGGGDHRQALADWLLDENNPYFARAVVNRLWKQLMGRGLIEPVDDLSETNPATHPELLDELARDFVAHGYDLRHTLRLIANSHAFGRDSLGLKENQADDRFYSHYFASPLEPEVLADAIADVTGVSEEYGDQPAGTRAVQLFSPTIPSRILDVLGRCDRVEACESSGPVASGITTNLFLLNGPALNSRVTAKEGRLQQVLNHKDGEIVTEFYLWALGRKPNKRESTFWREQLNSAQNETDRREMLEDFLWSLLTCREFATRR